jgi:hypothetical protein
MVATINPAVSGTRTKWIEHTAAFYLGAVGGFLGSVLVVATVAGILSLVLAPTYVFLTLLLPLSLSVMLRQAGVSVPVPYSGRQVPASWRSRLPMPLASLSYGAALGFGFATPFTSAAHLTALVALPLLRSVWIVLAAALLFAAGKTLIVVAGYGSVSHEQLIDKLDRVESSTRSRRVIRQATGIGAALLVLLAEIHALWVR